MNTTIHFVQDANQSTGQLNTYNWSNLDNMHGHLPFSIPIQQIHYVEQNLTFINNNNLPTKSSVSLIQMNPLEPAISINQSDSNQTTTNSVANLLSNEDNQMAYLTPLINVKLSEPVDNKIMPIKVEATGYNQQVVNSYYECNNTPNLVNPTLPSMAASFGSPVLVQSNCLNGNDGNSTTNQINNNQIKSIKTPKSSLNQIKTAKTDWINCSKPGRRPLLNKLNEQKEKYLNDYHLNNSSKMKKDQTKVVKLRKRLSSIPTNQIINKITVNLSNAPNNLCNLNSICSSNLNNSNNSIHSINSLCSSNNSTNKQLNKKQPENVVRRNHRERMRVKEVNMGFQNLRNHLPINPSNKKMSKVETLRNATKYIKFLFNLLNESSSECSSNNFQNSNQYAIKDQLNDSCKNNLKMIKPESDSQSNIQKISYYESY